MFRGTYAYAKCIIAFGFTESTFLSLRRIFASHAFFVRVQLMRCNNGIDIGQWPVCNTHCVCHQQKVDKMKKNKMQPNKLDASK